MRRLRLSIILLTHCLIAMTLSHLSGTTSEDINKAINSHNIRAAISKLKAQNQEAHHDNFDSYLKSFRKKYISKYRDTSGLKDDKQRRKRSDDLVSSESNSWINPAIDRPSIYLKLFPRLMQDNRMKNPDLPSYTSPLQEETTTAPSTPTPTVPTNRASVEFQLNTNKPITEHEREDLREIRHLYPHTFHRLLKGRESTSPSHRFSNGVDSTSEISSDFYSTSEEDIHSTSSASFISQYEKAPTPSEYKIEPPITYIPTPVPYPADTLSTSPEFPTVSTDTDKLRTYIAEDRRRDIRRLASMIEFYKLLIKRDEEETIMTTTPTTTTEKPSLSSSLPDYTLTSTERSVWREWKKQPVTWSNFYRSSPHKEELSTTTTPPLSPESSLFTEFRGSYSGATSPAPADENRKLSSISSLSYGDDDVFSSAEEDSDVLKSDDSFF